MNADIPGIQNVLFKVHNSAVVFVSVTPAHRCQSYHSGYKWPSQVQNQEMRPQNRKTFINVYNSSWNFYVFFKATLLPQAYMIIWMYGGRELD